MSVLKQRAVLTDESGPVDGAVPLSLSVAIDTGWNWSANFNVGIDVDHAKDKPYTLTIYDDINDPMPSPPLCALPRQQVDSRSTSEAGMGNAGGCDLAMQKMRVRNQSFPTFVGTDTAAVVDALEAKAGVTISGEPNWPVYAEDIKQQKLSDFLLTRLLKLAAYDFIAKKDGTLECIPWETTSGTLNVPWAKLVRNGNPWSKATGLRVGKVSEIQTGEEQDNTYDFYEAGAPNQALETPVRGPVPTNLSSNDGLGAITFLSEDDVVVDFYSFKPTLYQYTGPKDVTLIATKMTVIVDPLFGSLLSNFPTPVRFVVAGQPADEVDEGIDAEFINPKPTEDGPDESLGDNPASEEYIDSLWPNEEIAVERRPHCLAKINGPLHLPIEITVDILFTAVWLKEEFTYGLDVYQVVAIAWDLVGCTTKITLWRI